MKGAANVSLSLGKIGSVKVPLPPLREQLRLIDKLTKLEARLEETQAYLRRLREEKSEAILQFRAKFF
jgi:restriction endonuclease S subunit